MKTRLSMGLLALAVAACADIVAPRPSTEYALESIDGQVLPAVLLVDYDIEVSVISDVITLRADSTFIEVATFRGVSGDGELTALDSIAGTYSISGTRLYLLLAGGQTSQMHLAGDSLTQNFGRALVYRLR